MEIIKSPNYILIKELQLPSYTSFWEEITTAHPNCEVDFVFQTTPPPVAFLTEINATLMDDDVTTILQKENFTPVQASAIPTQLIEADFPAFASLHNTANPEMYWNPDRILEKFHHWCIYILKNAYIMLATWDKTQGEIFALHAPDTPTQQALLNATATQAFAMGKETIRYDIPSSDTQLLNTATTLGFAICGKTQMYRTHT